MPDLTIPSSTVLTYQETLALMNQEITALEANALVQTMLYQNVVTPTPETNLTNLTECTFGGYARATIAAWSGAFLDASGNAYIEGPLTIFTANGTGSNSVYGSALVKDNGGTQATATNAGNSGAYASTFVITNGGTQYQTPPPVTLTGATGSGATAHAVLTGGVVSSIVLDTPGSAYTTYTVVIGKPQSLAAINPFAAPVSMALTTDALSLVQQITLPPIQTT